MFEETPEAVDDAAHPSAVGEFREFLRDVQDALQDAALYSLYVLLAFAGDWLAHAVNYRPPFPLDAFLQWLPGLTLVFLVLMPLVRLVIRRALSLRKMLKDEA